MSDKRDAAFKVMEAMFEPALVEQIKAAGANGDFGEALSDFSLDFVFGSVWARPGLSHRDRSLVTMGILIALRASDQLRVHVASALKNGLTKDEIAEVIYQAAAYAGFPAAANALGVASQVVNAQK